MNYKECVSCNPNLIVKLKKDKKKDFDFSNLENINYLEQW